MSNEASSSELVHVVTLLGAAVVVVPLFRRLGLGSVLGYLVAGLVIGPFGLGLFSQPETILHVAELGVVLFLFVVGLEMRPSRLWGLRKQIFGLEYVADCCLQWGADRSGHRPGLRPASRVHCCGGVRAHFNGHRDAAVDGAR